MVPTKPSAFMALTGFHACGTCGTKTFIPKGQIVYWMSEPHEVISGNIVVKTTPNSCVQLLAPISALVLLGDITYYSEEQLKEELSRREGEKKRVSIPKQNANPDFSKAIEMCKAQLEELAKNGYRGSNTVPYGVYAEVMTVLFGDSVWKWMDATEAGRQR